VDKAVFPGCQGTSAVNLIAAKALIFKLAQNEKFVAIQKTTLENAKLMARIFKNKGYRIVSNGTDNHQVLIDLSSKNITGKQAEVALESAGIILNRNVIPKDDNHPGRISGIRIGTAAISTRGMGKNQILKIVDLMDIVMMGFNNTHKTVEVKSDVLQLCKQFPINKSEFINTLTKSI
jgi:glycine hydroxymethyltransferase